MTKDAISVEIIAYASAPGSERLRVGGGAHVFTAIDSFEADARADERRKVLKEVRAKFRLQFTDGGAWMDENTFAFAKWLDHEYLAALVKRGEGGK